MAIEPQVIIEQASRSRGSEPDCWLVTWRIRNLGQEPLQILSGRLPHGLFRSAERELTMIPKLPPNGNARIEFPVACNGHPGTVVENAFLILRVHWLEQPWWIFARMRVAIDDQGSPHSMTEMVTTRRIGFSE